MEASAFRSHFVAKLGTGNDGEVHVLSRGGRVLPLNERTACSDPFPGMFRTYAV